MSRSYFLKTLCFILAAIGLLIFAAQPAAAASGTWTNTASGGSWGTTTNWSGGTVADGADNTADFSTLNITGDNTVHLNSARTIGNLLFGDTTPTNNWTLDNNGNSANILTLAVSSGSPTITVNNQTATISAKIAGTSGLTKAGGGTLTLGAIGTAVVNTYTGDTIINGGTLKLGGTYKSASNIIPDTSNVTVASGATFDFSSTSGDTQTTNVETIGALTINGGSALGNSSQPNTYYWLAVASLNMTGGTITLTNGNSNTKSALQLKGDVTTNASATTAQILGTGQVDLNGATRTFTIADGAAANDMEINSVIVNGTGTAGITKEGAGTLKFGTPAGNDAYSNTYNGMTTVNAGTLLLSKADNTFNTNQKAISSGGLTINNGGTVKYDSAAITNYSANQIDNAAAITVNTGGALDITTRSDTVGVVTLAGGTITGTTGVLTGSSYAVQSGTADAILGGGGIALTKTTSGTVNLSKANTYTGATDIKAGMILVKLATALPSGSAVTVRSGATLAVDTGIILTKTATWESGAILGGNGKYDIGAAFGPTGIHIAPGTSVGILTVDDGVNLSSGGNLDIQVDGATADLLQVTKTSGLGNLTLGGTSVLNVTEIIPGTFTQIAIVTYAGTRSGSFATVNLPSVAYSISYDDGNKQILLLPEPATMTLLGLGAFGIAFSRRRRR